MARAYIILNTFINAVFPLVMWPYVSKNAPLNVLDELSYTLTLFAFSNIFLDLATFTTTAKKYKKAVLFQIRNEIFISVIYVKIIISSVLVLFLLLTLNFEYLSSTIIVSAIFVHGFNNYWAFIASGKVRVYLIYNVIARMLALYFITNVSTVNYDVIYALGILFTELILGAVSFLALNIRFTRISKIIFRSTINDGFQQITTNLSVAQYRNIPMLLFPYFGPPEGYYSALFIIEKISRAPSMITVPLNTRNVINMENNKTGYKTHAWQSKDIIILSIISVLFLYFFKERIFSYFNIVETSINHSIYDALIFINTITVTTTIFSQNLFLVSGKYGEFTKKLTILGFLGSFILIICSVIQPKYFHYYLMLCELMICITLLQAARKFK